MMKKSDKFNIHIEYTVKTPIVADGTVSTASASIGVFTVLIFHSFGVGEWEIASSSTIIYQREKKLEYSNFGSKDFWNSEEVHYQPVYFLINT